MYLREKCRNTRNKEENRKVKRRKKESKEKEETVLLLCLIWLGRPYQEYKLQPA